MNPQANTNPTPSDKPKVPQTGRPHFQHRKPQTRTRSTSVPGTSVTMTPRPHTVSVAQTGHITTGSHDHSGHGHSTHSHSPAHRIVMGRGAKKPTGPHIAGARMNIMRKESRPMKRGGPARSLTHTQGEDVIPPLAPDSIRIIPFGGVEEIGRNMTAIEFGNDIIVVDIGFQFKDENTPGIDYILPNTKYLEERQSKVRAVLITHGHLDHVGGIPYIMPRIGNPPMYTRLLTSVLIQKRQEEFPDVPKIDMKIVEKDETITIGALKVKFFAVTHTIPDAMGVIIQTPYGSIVHTGDLKLDHNDGVPTDEENAEYDRAFKNENVLMLMADSTNVENPGFSIP